MINNNNNYYIYVFLDTRKPGIYEFDDLIFNFEPIYIGKGKNERLNRHFYLYKHNNTRFYSKIKAIINSNQVPLYFKIVEELSEIDALDKEIELIKSIKRIENGGTLTNLTDGGEGVSGLKMSDETKEKMSKSHLGKKIGKLSNETKMKISISRIGSISPMLNKKHSDESKAKMSEKAKLRVGEKNSMYGKKHSEESKEKMSNNTIRKYGKDNPSYGRIVLESQKITDEWKLINKLGDEVIVKNLNEFCRQNDLNSSCMRDIYYGRSKTHKNWVFVDKLTNNVKKKKVE